MTKFGVKPDGKWCIKSVEGVPFPGYDELGNPTDEKEATYNRRSNFIEGYKKEMGMNANEDEMSQSMGEPGGY